MKKQYSLFVAFLFFAFGTAQIVTIPDSAFKARLLLANPSNAIASTEVPNSISGYVSAYNTIDTNSDGEIQVSEASMIKVLRLDSNAIASLEGINFFTNLQLLECSTNQLISLDVSGLVNLKILRCTNNQLMTINVTGLINLLRLDCYENQITSLNVSGLSSLTNLDCYQNQISSLDLSGATNLVDIDCKNNALTSLNLSNLNNLQYLDCSNNVLTALSISNLASLFNIDCSSNQLQSLNLTALPSLYVLKCSNNQLSSLILNGLPILNTLYTHNNLLTSVNLNGLTGLQILTCSFNQLQSLDVSGLTNLHTLECYNNLLTALFLKNNNAIWYQILLWNNPNLTYICVDETDIDFVQSRIDSVGLSATCQANSYCSFTPGGTYYTIQGSTRIDQNTNGCNASDPLCSNMKFNITNGTISGSFLSNVAGSYVIPVSAGTHTITPQFENPSYFTVSPTSTSVTFPAVASPATRNFCILPNGVHHDLEIVVIPIGFAIPGFNTHYKIKYKNKGNQTENASISFNYNEAILDYVAASVTPTSQITGTLSWNVGTITPFQSGEIMVTLNLNSPMEIPAVNDGDVLSYTATADGLNTDETPDDNTFTLPQVVVNSFDPNDKTCLEGSTINPSNIGKYVHYKIRFENTGTFAAQNIVVKDMIDTAKFDLTSLQMTDASHSCVTRITNPDKVEFIFQNINLPFDDANNDGYLVFKIKTKPTLVVGNTISNSANIYFDYNFPIITNTATSTFQTLQNDTFVFDNYLTMYPNPVKEELNLKTKQDTEVYSLTIYNILGQQVQTTTNPTNTVDVSSLKTGNYIVKVVTDKGVSSGKFIKE